MTRAWTMCQAENLVDVIGCKGSDLCECHTLAEEAFGIKDVGASNSGLTAMAYLYRRFGPTRWGSDSYKEVCMYVLTTPMEGVWLMVSPAGSGLTYGVGYFCEKQIERKIYEPQTRYWSERGKAARERGFDPYGGKGSKGFAELEKEFGRPPEREDSREWRTLGGLMGQFNKALFDAMQELLVPTYCRDVYFNVLGVCEPGEKTAEYSDLAGIGVPVEEMKKLRGEK